MRSAYKEVRKIPAENLQARISEGRSNVNAEVKACGIPSENLGKSDIDSQRPRLSTIVTVANAFGLPPSELITEAGDTDIRVRTLKAAVRSARERLQRVEKDLRAAEHQVAALRADVDAARGGLMLAVTELEKAV
jgi:hypothetical protein